jgi:hypothetical protein
MDRDVRIARQRAAADRTAFAGSLSAARAGLPFVGARRATVNADVPAASAAADRGAWWVLPLAVVSGMAAGAFVPVTGPERRVGRSVIAPAAQTMWRGAVSAGSAWVIERALTLIADVLKGDTSHRRE